MLSLREDPRCVSHSGICADLRCRDRFLSKLTGSDVRRMSFTIFTGISLYSKDGENAIRYVPRGEVGHLGHIPTQSGTLPASQHFHTSPGI